MKTYSVLYAEDVPHYGTKEIVAASDEEAIAMAKTGPFDYADDPDWNHTVCKRIVHIEGPEGLIAEEIPLDSYTLIHGEDKRHFSDAADAMFAALEAQEMAEFDPEASRRKAYFDQARALREAALKKARGQQ